MNRVPQTGGAGALASLAFELAGSGQRRLFVTSTTRGEGRSWVAAETARALAEGGRESVLLVDGDQYRPALHRFFGVANQRGLCELLDEVYLFDIDKEDPHQFGIGDWLEILRAQRRSGELTVREDGKTFVVRLNKGTIEGITSGEATTEKTIVDELVRRRRLTKEKAQAVRRIQEETGRSENDVLTALDWVTSEDLANAARGIANGSLVQLVELRQPDCRFSEVADAHLPASGGRPSELAQRAAVDELAFGKMRGYLKSPFLSAQVSSYLADTPLANLKLLAAGQRPCDLLAPRYVDAFTLLMGRLGRVFDLVLVDGPPSPRLGAVSALAAWCDGVLFVVKPGAAEASAARSAVEELRRSGANILGVVLNQVPVTREEDEADADALWSESHANPV
jgi:Mrp family chromosome partitioning ATPase